MTEWEYRVEELSAVQTVNQLNFVGKEGWELVSVERKPGEPAMYLCFFKRKRGESLF